MQQQMLHSESERDESDEGAEDRDPANDSRGFDEVTEKILPEIHGRAVGYNAGSYEGGGIGAGFGPDHDRVAVTEEMLMPIRTGLGPIVGLPGRGDSGNRDGRSVEERDHEPVREKRAIASRSVRPSAGMPRERFDRLRSLSGAGWGSADETGSDDAVAAFSPGFGAEPLKFGKCGRDRSVG